ncbi:MAG: hypothetical protein JXA93_14800 [Anaerolineae bacterium]|nr:hypothetical protein [Anaerolineae bacterium]
MSDRLLSAIAAVDWISPLLAAIGNVMNGPSYTFLIPYDCGWSGRDVVSLLKQRGIKSWGHMIVQGTLMLTVRQTQADWAQRLLDQASIPVENPVTLPHTHKARQAPRHRREPQTRNRVTSIVKEVWNKEIF